MNWSIFSRLCPVLLCSVVLDAQSGFPVIAADEYSCFNQQEMSQRDKEFASVPPAVTGVLLDPESHTLAFSVRDGGWSRLVVLDANTGAPRWAKQFNSSIDSSDIAKGGTHIAVAFSNRLCHQSSVEVWDSKGEPQTHAGHDSAYAIAFSPDGTQLGIALGGAIQVWNLVLKKKVFDVDTPAPMNNESRMVLVSDITLDNKHHQLLATYYRSLYIWDIPSRRLKQVIKITKAANDLVQFVMLNQEGTIAAVGTNYSLYIVDLNSGKIVNSLIGLSPISFTEGGKSLILNNLTIWRHFKTVEPVPWFIEKQPTFYKAAGDKVFGIYLDDEAWQKDPHADLNGRLMDLTKNWPLCSFKIPGRPATAPPLPPATK